MRYRFDVASLADDVLHERMYLLEPLLERYMQWIAQHEREVLRSSIEYTVDILTFGVLWRCYGYRATALAPPLTWLMSGLGRLSGRNSSWKPAVDLVRSWLSWPLLGPRFGDVDATGIPSRYAIGALLRWMSATGEFKAESVRLRLLAEFLRSCDRYEREWYLAQISAFTARFGMMADKKLKRYSSGEARSLITQMPLEREMGGPVVATPKHVEYHICMVGAELMKRT